MTVQEDVDDLLEKLNRASQEAWQCKGEIITNAKGEASFKIRVYSNVAAEIQETSEIILKGLKSICEQHGIKIAGS